MASGAAHGCARAHNNGLTLKIAHVTATFPPYWGGTGNVAYHNARILHKKGYEVAVFTATPVGRKAMSFHFEVNYLNAPFRIGNAPLTPGLPSQLQGFDLIHLHWPYIFGAELSVASARLHHTPLVVTYHNDLVASGARGMAFNIYSTTSQPLLLRMAEQIIVTSQDYAEHSHLARNRSLAAKVREVPNGVDVETFKPGAGADAAYRQAIGLPADALYALFVGAMDNAHFFKGVPILLEAMMQVGDFHLVLVGDGDLRAGFEATAHAVLSARAHFLQSVELPRLVELYQGAAVTVLPSITQGEAFGMVLLESLACGTPVVASNLPGVRSVVTEGEDGKLVPAGDAPVLALALRELLQSESARKQMGARGRQKVKTRYQWPVIGDQLESVYEEVLSRTNRTPSPRAGSGGRT